MRESGKRSLLIYLSGLLLAGIVAVVITIIVARPSTDKGAKESSATNSRDGQSLSLSDFHLNVPSLIEENRWHSVRPPKERWQEEESLRFWRDPIDMGIEKFGGESDEVVEELFEEIP